MKTPSNLNKPMEAKLPWIEASRLNSEKVARRQSQPSLRAFTRVDALASLAMLAVLFLLLLPTLANPGLNSKSFRCLNNLRQMCNAWRMYSDDNSDRIVYASTAPDRSGSVPIDTVNPSDPNNFAWTGAHLDFSGGNFANWDPTFDILRRPLWPYTKRDLSIYKCPSDQSAVFFTGTSTYLPRVQSLMMNLYLGGFTGSDGGWAFADPYRIYLKTTDLTAPSPAKAFVFVDSRYDDVSWGNFMTDMDGFSPNNPLQYTFADQPGFLHDGAAGFCFADGHTEMHLWTDRRTTPPEFSTPLSTSANNLDIAWLQEHSTALK
jgi:prepilin-type processing-associated H-X9-DG protein